ncbi:AzlC family ABC transporter permease [Halomonas sp. A40-4]|jgi:predicted branched-subunit amino acid permease|uniref:AzlC family ABC transporter permease n=1 Tax=Halomonas sp. A40-4 TaxID=2785909 RepID=UPI0018EFEB66|nr:AzlC family ABC transporter permease [Halomonas sp. A40-4]QPL47634.1 AzlC family ABC transporter permease [Halomonas sp. A40-4]
MLSKSLIEKAASMLAAMALIGFSFGSLSGGQGLPAWVLSLLALLVFSGGAELLAVTLSLAGASPVFVLMNCLLLNLRFFPLGLSVGEIFSSSSFEKLVASHFVVDEIVALTFTQDSIHMKRKIYWIASLTLIVVWPSSVFLGAHLSSGGVNTEAFGIDIVLPVAILLLIIPAIKTLRMIFAVMTSVLTTTFAYLFLPAGISILLAPLIVAFFFVPRGVRS